MNIASKLACAAATAVAATGLMMTPANAATAVHCPSQEGKVETNGEPTVLTDLPDGTLVCYKAGTQIGYATVINGTITSTLLNKNGNGVLGVSYYVPGECQTSSCA